MTNCAFILSIYTRRSGLKMSKVEEVRGGEASLWHSQQKLPLKTTKGGFKLSIVMLLFSPCIHFCLNPVFICESITDLINLRYKIRHLRGGYSTVNVSPSTCHHFLAPMINTHPPHTPKVDGFRWLINSMLLTRMSQQPEETHFLLHGR